MLLISFYVIKKPLILFLYSLAFNRLLDRLTIYPLVSELDMARRPLINLIKLFNP